VTLSDIGLAMLDDGRAREALACLRRALGPRLARLGPHHSLVAESLKHLAQARARARARAGGVLGASGAAADPPRATNKESRPGGPGAGAGAGAALTVRAGAAQVFGDRGDPRRAARYLVRALEIESAALDEAALPLPLAHTRFLLARTQEELGDAPPPPRVLGGHAASLTPY
jgi:hypothetical protein